ncbi:MAG: DNA recombination protein RmuC [Candidatus Tectomicrobia bacterium]
MTSINPLVAILVMLVLVVVVWIAILTRRQGRQLDSQALGLLQQQMEGLRHQVHEQQQAMTQQLQTFTGQVGSRLDTTSQLVGEVNQNLGALSKATEHLYQVGKDIATLQDILQSPKLRGNLGELLLQDMLAQILPPAFYRSQYRFRSGDIVDAVILLGNRHVPIDAKFPLENFRRLRQADSDPSSGTARRRLLADAKRHIDAIATKYILPDEGTYDFSLMYIPAENVYYEIILRGDDGANDLLPYALQRRVFPVSPVSLYAYLQTIVMGLRGLQIEEHAQEVLQHLSRLHRDTGLLREAFEVLGRHVTHAYNKYDEVGRLLTQLENKLGALESSDTTPLTESIDEAVEREEAPHLPS